MSVVINFFSLLNNWLRGFSSHIYPCLKRIRKAIKRSIAVQWFRAARLKNRIIFLQNRHSVVVRSFVLIVLIGSSVLWAPNIQNTLESFFSTDRRISGLSSLLLTLGGALIGGAAIAFSLVIFAMQVNVERTPHGLFKKLSMDRKLLGAFTCTFILAISISISSIIIDKSWPWLTIAVIGAGWGTVLVILLFLYAYRRAISLINPLKQLVIILNYARKEMRRWDRRARRAAPLLEPPEETRSKDEVTPVHTHDLPRMQFFENNHNWTGGSQQAIRHTISFARRFAEQGDHEVSSAALDVIVKINEEYIITKGKTFFSNTPLVDNPLSTDGFINETLEYLRQNIRIGLSRGDEQLIELTFQTIAHLILVYLKIDYASEYASKTHANVAAKYLSDGVQSVIPHNMPDVVMEGLRLLGSSAKSFIDSENENNIALITEKIASIACVGALKKEYLPITLIGVEQLAQLTFYLIQAGSYDIKLAASKLTEEVATVAEIILNIPDTPLSNTHSYYLKPYYSCTNIQSLVFWLTGLVDTLLNAEENNNKENTIINNLEKWASRLYQADKDTLLLALEKRSRLAFDLIQWISHITKLLLAVSNAPACDDYTGNKLRSHALWLISVFSWIPDNQEVIQFAETLFITETLFISSRDAYHCGCIEVADKVRDILFSWAFKAGKYQMGRASLKRAIYGLVVLVLDRDDEKECEKLKASISAYLEGEIAPSQEIRDRTAREIRQRAATLYGEKYSPSIIASAMSSANHEKLKSLLKDIADILSR